MYSFDDSANAPGPFATAQGVSGTPIFDKLMEEWQRMFRAVPGDRYGEAFGAASSSLPAYAQGAYGMSAPMPVPAFRPDPGYAQAYGSSAGFAAPQQAGPGGYGVPQQGAAVGAMGNSGGYGAPHTGAQAHTPPPVHYAMDTPPPMHAQSHPQQLGGYDPYGRPVRHAQQQSHAHGAVRSELALMPVAGYQAQQMPL